MVAINLIKFLDRYIGFIICWFISIIPRKSSNIYSNLKSILIIQLWGIGESILTLPALESLKKKYDDCEIYVLATQRNQDVYFQNRTLKGLKLISLNPIAIFQFIFVNYRKFDLVIDMEEYLNVSSILSFFVGIQRIGFSHKIRSRLYTDIVKYNDNQHVVSTFMDLLKPLDINEKYENLPYLKYSSEDMGKVKTLFKKFTLNQNDLLVGLGVGAAESAKSRMWPKDRFSILADFLIDNYGAKILFIGNDSEKELIEEIQNIMKNKNSSYSFAGQITVREMFYLISLCRLFIGNDSGPMHVAAAQGVTTIGLFGCNLPVRFSPYGPKNYSIRKRVGIPCINVHEGDVSECQYGIEDACVKKIQPIDVISIVKKLMKKK